MTRILVSGGRDFKNSKLVDKILNEAFIKYENDIFLILGGADGVDTFAQLWAINNRISHTVLYADWNQFKKRAGYIRNVEMTNSNPDVAFIFPGNEGTKMMMKICVEKNIEVIKIT